MLLRFPCQRLIFKTNIFLMQKQISKPANSGWVRNFQWQRKGPAFDRPIRFKCGLFNTILDVLRNRPGWEEVKAEDENQDWDFFWCEREWLKENFDHMYFPDHVRLCHFRNHFELTRKNLMVKNLKRMRKQVEKEQGKLEASKWEFFPTTYELPSEYHIFVEEFKRQAAAATTAGPVPAGGGGPIWIMKPAARSQGKGIFLFRRLKDIMDWARRSEPGSSSNAAPAPSGGDPNAVPPPPPETYVVQRYIDNPYLIGGRKFDIRVYVLVTSYVPLKVYLYRDGFARFSNTRFSLDSLEDSYVHLTNVAVQKTAPDYDPEKGCKWSTRRLREFVMAKHGIERAEELFRDIENIFIKSLTSVQKIIINDKHTFEMYGYDILVDDNLKPWLLEINASPSLTASSQDDYNLKVGLLDDVLNIIDVEGRLTGKEKHIGGWDLIWLDGPVPSEDPGAESGLYSANYSHNSFLGCHMDRLRQLKALYRDVQMNKSRTGEAQTGGEGDAANKQTRTGAGGTSTQQGTNRAGQQTRPPQGRNVGAGGPLQAQVQVRAPPPIGQAQSQQTQARRVVTEPVQNRGPAQMVASVISGEQTSKPKQEQQSKQFNAQQQEQQQEDVQEQGDELELEAAAGQEAAVKTILVDDTGALEADGEERPNGDEADLQYTAEGETGNLLYDFDALQMAARNEE